MSKELSRTVYVKNDGKWEFILKQTEPLQIYEMLSHHMICKFVRKEPGYRMTSKYNLDGTRTITFTFGIYKCIYIVDE